MKFYQRRSVALIVLVLAIIGASVYGLGKRPAQLPEVTHYQWICDEKNLLRADTEQTIEQYNDAWNDKYYAVIAVAAVKDIDGWTQEDFVAELGGEWGLGANDMLLLLVENGDYYVGLGDNVLYAMTDTQQTKLKSAIEPDYYDGDFDSAVVAFFRQADVFYAQMAATSSYTDPGNEWAGGSTVSHAGTSLFGVIVVVCLVFILWAMLDRVRYTRYRRRVVVTPGIVYRPIFWGRPRRPAPPRRPVPPPPRPQQPPRRPAGGGYTPPRSSAPRRSNSSSFGNGGFGGGSRSGGSSRSSAPRSSGSRSGAPRSSSRSGGSRGGSRGGGFGGGGFGGGRR